MSALPSDAPADTGKAAADVAAATAEVAAADIEAARRVLLHVVSTMELLGADIKALIVALDKGSGEASALAARLLDDPEDLWRYNLRESSD